MTKKISPQSSQIPKDFDIASAIDELDAISSRLQSSDVDLGEVMKQFERGNELGQQIKTYLDEAENTIHTLKQKF